MKDTEGPTFAEMLITTTEVLDNAAMLLVKQEQLLEGIQDFLCNCLQEHERIFLLLKLSERNLELLLESQQN